MMTIEDHIRELEDAVAFLMLRDAVVWFRPANTKVLVGERSYTGQSFLEAVELAREGESRATHPSS